MCGRVRRDARVARDRERNKSEVGEARKAAIANAARMTARAIAFRRIVEHRETARLLCGQRRLSTQHRVVLAVVRIEVRCALLGYLERERDSLERVGPIVEHARSERGAQVVGTRRPFDARHDRVLVRVRHLERRQQRDARLVVLRRRTAVPVMSAGRTLILAVVAVGLDEVLGERRHALQIAQRRHCAHAWQAHRRTTELHRAIVRGPVCMRGVVARPTRHAAGRRQVRIEEQRTAQRRQRRRRRRLLEARAVERR